MPMAVGAGLEMDGKGLFARRLPRCCQGVWAWKLLNFNAARRDAVFPDGG